MKKGYFLLFLIFIFIINLNATAEVILKDNKIVLSGDKIYLGDVADLIGFDDKSAEELSNIYLKKAPLPGNKTIIPKELIANKLLKYYGKVKIRGPDKVTIIIKNNAVMKSDIVKVALNYIKEKMPWREDEVEIEVKKINDKDIINTPEGEVLLKVKESFSTNFKGNIVVPVEIYIDNKFYRIETISLFLKVNKECFLTIRNIRSRERLAENDIEIIKKDITYLPDDIILSQEELNNLVTRKAILKGTLLLRSMFESQPLFRKGARVSVVVKVKNIQIETEGITLEDGRPNDLLRVKLDNGKILEGRVNSEGKIIIEK